MSIVACVKVHDGIALGCDSATTIFGHGPEGQVGVLKTYENARKLFRFRELPVGILSYGIGNLGPKSIQTLLREFDKEFSFNGDDHTVEQVANGLFKFVTEKYNKFFENQPQEKKPVMGMYIAGYSSNASMGEEWEFRIPHSNEARQVRDPKSTGASWRGIDVPFTRLFFGFDPRAKAEYEKAGLDLNIIDKVNSKLGAKVIFDGMPVKDAVNFVKFILNTTIGLNSFEIGAPTCSEPMQIAVIDSIKGFNWVERPILYERKDAHVKRNQ